MSATRSASSSESEDGHNQTIVNTMMLGDSEDIACGTNSPAIDAGEHLASDPPSDGDQGGVRSKTVTTGSSVDKAALIGKRLRDMRAEVDASERSRSQMLRERNELELEFAAFKLYHEAMKLNETNINVSTSTPARQSVGVFASTPDKNERIARDMNQTTDAHSSLASSGHIRSAAFAHSAADVPGAYRAGAKEDSAHRMPTDRTSIAAHGVPGQLPRAYFAHSRPLASSFALLQHAKQTEAAYTSALWPRTIAHPVAPTTVTHRLPPWPAAVDERMPLDAHSLPQPQFRSSPLISVNATQPSLTTHVAQPPYPSATVYDTSYRGGSRPITSAYATHAAYPQTTYGMPPKMPYAAGPSAATAPPTFNAYGAPPYGAPLHNTHAYHQGPQHAYAAFQPFALGGDNGGEYHRVQLRKLQDLPTFDGRPESWPSFANAFYHTTAAYGYTQLENQTRLQKSLCGEARQQVECLLIHPHHVHMAMHRLESIYGRPELLVRSQLKVLRALPNIREENIIDLVEFATKVQNLAMFLDAPSTQHHLADPTLLEELIQKLPMGRRINWAAEVMHLGYQPTIVDFAQHVTAVADLISHVMSDAEVHQSKPPSRPANKRHVLLSVEDSASLDAAKCAFCSKNHDISKCASFLNLPLADRWVEVRKRTLCIACLSTGHWVPSCDQRRQWGLGGCDRWHHTLLHNHKTETVQATSSRNESVRATSRDNTETVQATSRDNTETVQATSSKNESMQATSSKENTHTPSGGRTFASHNKRKTGRQRNKNRASTPAAQPALGAMQQKTTADGQRTSGAETMTSINHCREVMRKSILFRIVPVTLHGTTGDVATYALLDEGSSISLIDADLARQVGLRGPSSKLNVQWFSSDSTDQQDSMQLSFDLTGQQSGCGRVTLHNVRTVQGMSLPTQTVHTPSLVKQCPHLKEVPIADYENAKPQILIGLDHHHLGVALEVRIDADQRSFVAAKTLLGWVLYGSDGPAPHARPTVLHARDGDDDRYELLNKLVQSHFSTESFGTKMPEVVLESDKTKRAREIYKQTTRRMTDDHFETGLLWRTTETRFPSSFEMALRRLQSVEARMRRDPEFRDRYVAEIESYVQKGYARRLANAEARQTSDRTWFLPHFAVFNANKPDKFRLVFDAAATVGRVSLNTELLTGPDVNVPLLRLLMQFRVGLVGMVADIREMFHQVRIRPEDQMAQRFLWRAGDSSVAPSVYAMSVMTFGATCSPASAQLIKNTNASEFAAQYPEAADAIQHHHYVDDFVASYDSEEKAARIASDVVTVHRKAGFELRGFASNSQRALELLGASTGSGDMDISLQLEASDDEKVLGMCWNTATDTFQFRTKFVRVQPDVLDGTRTPTKREILSVSMSLFDPFGLIADFVLESKLILQDIWRIGLDWDTPVPNQIAKRWEAWRREVDRTKLLQVARCYSRYLLTSEDVQLHVFADASEAAFAAVAYWRVVHRDGVDVSFVLARTRCAPLQILSIPRLELQAAVLATRLLTDVRESHPDVVVSKVTLWSDSATVLSWLRADQRKYKPFVQFRVAEILETTQAAQPANWRWVPTSMNVADDATRVKQPVVFHPDGRWTRGPAWLRQNEKNWPVSEEVRRSFVGTAREFRPIFVYERFSSFSHLCRVAARVRRYVTNLRLKTTRRVTGPVNAKEIESALLMLCRMVQLETYGKEIAAMRREDRIDRSSDLYSLNAYLEGDLLRMSGRTDAADDQYMPYDTRRPILLPRKHRFTWLLVMDQHERMAHQLANATIAAIRRRFWVPQVRVLVRSVQSKCVVCKRRLAQPIPPVQGQLPADRLTPYVRPFTSTGLDYFGPVFVTVVRRREKRWVVVFTCLAIRAVHLEVAADLTTDACLVCVRNLCHVRGTPSHIRCDNGTNFVGARNKLATEDGFLDAATMQRELSKTGIQWVMNCPGNPEAGGIWERMVQAVKRILSVTLKDEAPRVETLRAYLLEAANMLNSRPLTHIAIAPDDDEALTPNHFLIGGPNAATMTDPTDAEPEWVRQQWRICRELTRRFWVQFVNQHLPDLTRRSKHHPERKELAVDDVVVVCDSSQPRGRWLIGRICSVATSPDGRVRTAEVRTKEGVYRRPVARLAVLDILPGSN